MKNKNQKIELKCDYCHRTMNSIYENKFKTEDSQSRQSAIDKIAEMVGFKGFAIHDYCIEDFLIGAEMTDYEKSNRKDQQLKLFSV